MCGSYYYGYQGSYYCFTGGMMPGVGMMPGANMMSPMGVPLQTYWINVAPQYQYYNTPYDDYGYDWYAQRHLAYPQMYSVYPVEPVGVCPTYYYYFAFDNQFYCYNGT